MSAIQSAQIEFNEFGTPVSHQFDDVYFSNKDGLAETQYVFLDKNELTTRWQELRERQQQQPETSLTFHIAETGFGTGLNFLAAWALYQGIFTSSEQHPTLVFTSFEKHPLTQQDLRQALSHWPQFAKLSESLLNAYPEQLVEDSELILQGGKVCLRLIVGDVNDRMPKLADDELQADAWFLDGFAPSKNPDMWTQILFDNMARLTVPMGTLATFTAAGFVRRGLAQAGFIMSKHKGFGIKREMLAGRKPI